MTMLDYGRYPVSTPRAPPEVSHQATLDRAGDQSLEARVKPDCVHLYPGVDPKTWYKVLQEGEYRDDMEGLWIQVNDWVTYVLAKHFDVQSRSALH
jgi:hypothetical protein